MTPEQIAWEFQRWLLQEPRFDSEVVSRVASLVSAARLEAAKAMQERCLRELEKIPGEQEAIAAIRALNPETDDDT